MSRCLSFSGRWQDDPGWQDDPREPTRSELKEIEDALLSEYAEHPDDYPDLQEVFRTAGRALIIGGPFHPVRIKAKQELRRFINYIVREEWQRRYEESLITGKDL